MNGASEILAARNVSYEIAMALSSSSLVDRRLSSSVVVVRQLVVNKNNNGVIRRHPSSRAHQVVKSPNEEMPRLAFYGRGREAP